MKDLQQFIKENLSTTVFENVKEIEKTAQDIIQSYYKSKGDNVLITNCQYNGDMSTRDEFTFNVTLQIVRMKHAADAPEFYYVYIPTKALNEKDVNCKDIKFEENKYR